jgi:hypothetical protein
MRQVRALALVILTGGATAAEYLGDAYYLEYARAAREGGMAAVMGMPFYARHNRSLSSQLGA